jgi:hypothetical protein
LLIIGKGRVSRRAIIAGLQRTKHIHTGANVEAQCVGPGQILRDIIELKKHKEWKLSIGIPAN